MGKAAVTAAMKSSGYVMVGVVMGGLSLPMVGKSGKGKCDDVNEPNYLFLDISMAVRPRRYHKKQDAILYG